MGKPLRFITQWTFDEPIDRVWAVLSKPDLYPKWWPGFETVATVSGAGDVGTVTDDLVNVGFGMRLHFRMTVEEMKAPQHSRSRVEGDSAGVTEWRLVANGRGTSVTHLWDVTVQRRSLRLMSLLPGSYGFFKRRHVSTMRAGHTNLIRLLQKGEL